MHEETTLHYVTHKDCIIRIHNVQLVRISAMQNKLMLSSKGFCQEIIQHSLQISHYPKLGLVKNQSPQLMVPQTKSQRSMKFSTIKFRSLPYTCDYTMRIILHETAVSLHTLMKSSNSGYTIICVVI